jgi:hypothetical protein
MLQIEGGRRAELRHHPHHFRGPAPPFLPSPLTHFLRLTQSPWTGRSETGEMETISRISSMLETGMVGLQSALFGLN